MQGLMGDNGLLWSPVFRKHAILLMMEVWDGGVWEMLAGFKYHLYADNFKFISQLSLRPRALNSSIYLLISLGHPGMSQTQLGQTPHSAPVLGSPGLCSSRAPPLLLPCLLYATLASSPLSQHSQSPGCFPALQPLAVVLATIFG